MHRPLLVTLGALGIAASAFLAMSRAPGSEPPRASLDDVATFAPLLERGATVRYRRVPCDAEREHRAAQTGVPAPEVIEVDSLVTFGPLPEASASSVARMLHNAAIQQLADAERMTVTDVASARAQAREILDGAKARQASNAMLEGHYWTVAANSHPRLPEHWSYYAASTDQTGPDGKRLDVFIPLDLLTPELRVPYEALISLENELRREHAEAFNRLDWNERAELLARADQARHGGKVTPPLPEYFWRLDIDRTTLRAVPHLRADPQFASAKR